MNQSPRHLTRRNPRYKVSGASAFPFAESIYPWQMSTTKFTERLLNGPEETVLYGIRLQLGRRFTCAELDHQGMTVEAEMAVPSELIRITTWITDVGPDLRRELAGKRFHGLQDLMNYLDRFVAGSDMEYFSLAAQKNPRSTGRKNPRYKVTPDIRPRGALIPKALSIYPWKLQLNFESTRGISDNGYAPGQPTNGHLSMTEGPLGAFPGPPKLVGIDKDRTDFLAEASNRYWTIGIMYGREGSVTITAGGHYPLAPGGKMKDSVALRDPVFGLVKPSRDNCTFADLQDLIDWLDPTVAGSPLEYFAKAVQKNPRAKKNPRHRVHCMTDCGPVDGESIYSWQVQPIQSMPNPTTRFALTLLNSFGGVVWRARLKFVLTGHPDVRPLHAFQGPAGAVYLYDLRYYHDGDEDRFVLIPMEFACLQEMLNWLDRKVAGSDLEYFARAVQKNPKAPSRARWNPSTRQAHEITLPIRRAAAQVLGLTGIHLDAVTSAFDRTPISTWSPEVLTALSQLDRAIAVARRRKAQETHPDKYPGQTDLTSATEKQKALNEAKDDLSVWAESFAPRAEKEYRKRYKADPADFSSAPVAEPTPPPLPATSDADTLRAKIADFTLRIGRTKDQKKRNQLVLERTRLSAQLSPARISDAAQPSAQAEEVRLGRLHEAAEHIAVEAVEDVLPKGRREDKADAVAYALGHWYTLRRNASVEALHIEAAVYRQAGWKLDPYVRNVIAEMVEILKPWRNKERPHAEKTAYEKAERGGKTVGGAGSGETTPDLSPSPEDILSQKDAPSADVIVEGFLERFRQEQPAVFRLYSIHVNDVPLSGLKVTRLRTAKNTDSSRTRGSADLHLFHSGGRVKSCPTCKTMARLLRMDLNQLQRAMDSVVSSASREQIDISLAEELRTKGN